MRRSIALILCFLFPVASFAASRDENSYKVTYDGGSIQGVKAGDGMRLVIEPTQFRLVRGKDEQVAVIPANSITEISYGQDVHRRIGAAIGVAVFTLGIGALLALTKSKKHFVGITWANGDAKGGFAMQCDKNEYRGILNALQGISGKKAVDSDAMTVKN
ncbi:MAG TPA: hypothetical protein VGN16_03000 [Acidobacteriaceae bacterium]|jgi:hypothetical protein